MAFSKNSSLFLLITTFIACFSSSIQAKNNNLPASTISAAPAILPDSIAPLSSPSPALSPDMYPLFPSPGGPELSPSESSLPLIPSSPSPPNPDAMAAPGPGMAFAPSGFLPESSSVRLNAAPGLLSWVVLGLGGILVNSAL